MKKSWNSPGHLFSHFRTNPVLTYALVEKRKLFLLKTQARVIQGLHYSVGSYIKLSGIHGGWCWFDMNISIGTHQIFINLISVQRGGIYLSDDVKKLEKFGI